MTGAKKSPQTTKAPPADRRVDALLATLRADRNLASVVDAFEARQKAPSGRKFGSNGLKVNGKLFALFTQETLVVKLPKARVGALVAAGVGKPFDPGHGRLMKEWLTITGRNARWAELAREAHDFVAGSSIKR